MNEIFLFFILFGRSNCEERMGRCLIYLNCPGTRSRAAAAAYFSAVLLVFFFSFLFYFCIFFFQKYSRLFLSSETRPFILLYMYISIYFFCFAQATRENDDSYDSKHFSPYNQIKDQRSFERERWRTL